MSDERLTDIARVNADLDTWQGDDRRAMLVLLARIATLDLDDSVDAGDVFNRAEERRDLLSRLATLRADRTFDRAVAKLNEQESWASFAQRSQRAARLLTEVECYSLCPKPKATR